MSWRADLELWETQGCDAFGKYTLLCTGQATADLQDVQRRDRRDCHEPVGNNKLGERAGTSLCTCLCTQNIHKRQVHFQSLRVEATHPTAKAGTASASNASRPPPPPPAFTASPSPSPPAPPAASPPSPPPPTSSPPPQLQSWASPTRPSTAATFASPGTQSQHTSSYKKPRLVC